MKFDRRRFLAGCASGIALAACSRTMPGASDASSASAAPGTDVSPAFDAMGELRTTYAPNLIQEMLDSGLRAITVTLSDPKITGPEAFTEGMAALEDCEAYIRANAELLIAARDAADIDRAVREGKIAVFYLFQNSTPFGEDLANVDRFHAAGLRSCQVTYNDCNLSGCGSRMADAGGLTAHGHELVARMNELRMLVDLGHANMETMADTIRASSAPVIISHTGCDAVYANYRNTSDANLRLLAEHGGVVGIYQIRPFLTAAGSADALGDYFRHIRHAVDVCGFEGVAIGSDRDHRRIVMTPEYLEELRREEGTNFNEADWPLYMDELNGPGRMDVIRSGLRELGYSEDNCDRIMMGNLVRLYREVIG